MIGYVTLWTNDLAKAVTFYDQLFATIGADRMLENDTFVAWTTSPNKPGLSVTKPFNGESATAGNGTMVAIHLDSQEKVDNFYQKAIELGATDEGKPGFRGENNSFYAGYFRDLDNNKLNAFYLKMS